MLNKKGKLLEIKTSALVDSLFIGNYKTKHKGRGIEFADFKEYDYSDQVKNIDFVKSEKEGRILVKIFDEERELSVYFIIDLNDTFYTDLISNKKIDLVYELFYLIGLSAIKQGDKIGAFIFDDFNKKLHFAKKGKQNFINIVKSIEDFGKINKKISFIDKIKNRFLSNINNGIVGVNVGLKYFNSLKIKNSLVFLLTDRLDIDNKQLRILGVKNDLIVCNIFNSFENTLNKNGILGFNKGDNNIFLDLDNENKKDEYIKLRKNKINNFKKKIYKNGGKYILLDETINIYKEVYNLFKK